MNLRPLARQASALPLSYVLKNPVFSFKGVRLSSGVLDWPDGRFRGSPRRSGAAGSRGRGLPKSPLARLDAKNGPTHIIYRPRRDEHAREREFQGASASRSRQTVTTRKRIRHERPATRRAINKLLETAGRADWDGEDALAVTPETVRLAEKLAELFPGFAEPPDVSASPHGEIDFDWCASKNVMLTVCVCPSGEIAFAGLFNGSEIHGQEPWAEGDPLPRSVKTCFDTLRESAIAEG